jgi:MFS family permease
LAVRLILGVASFLPLIAVLTLIAFLFEIPRGFWSNAQAMSCFPTIWLGFVIAAGISLLLGVYYLRLVWRSDAVESDRQFWVTLLLRYFPIAGPVFWYRVIWRRRSLHEATKKA